ncbi:hypothetical protein [Haliangium ochraceum]|uniref:Uncharacterized protein n=1 Tax=Haliangium ochraceum (strain DSM 14365 / JCM 11303 / SMP-2) TaxID=502025 RepID=D0LUZ9_HALO1|nr:hypothetical protein [Haliangium ochraceum]ACY15840.1 hypothetical protein Hoch_3338 [Haliangium ochraceum DSM 14365]
MSLPLDSLATIFIFLIGLPAIFLQTLAAEVRHTVLKERRQLALFTLGPIGLAFLTVAVGVYLTHPRGLLAGYINANRAEIIWLFGTTALLSVCGGTAVLLIERWRRDAVIERWRRAAATGIDINGRPLEAQLGVLVELGVQSHGGEDKNLVIAALDRLVADTQARAAYDGAQLEELVKGLEDILVSGPHTPSPANFKTGAELLERMVWESRDRPESDDLKRAIQLAGILGRAALRYEQPHDQIKFLEILAFAGEGDDLGYATWVSQAVLEIGSEAIGKNRILVAMTALDKLESLVFAHSPVRGELAHDFVGLVAHFHDQGGTCRDYGDQYLDASVFADPLPEVVAQAREACIQGARFRTGNYLTALLAELSHEPAD